jgi:glycine cleavage system H protein
MAVLLVLVTFLVFALADWLLSRGRAPKFALVEVPEREVRDAMVDGFTVHDRLRYHPGHAWCMEERKNIERVGIDDFATRLTGVVDRIELPRPGQWIRQGQKALSFLRDGVKVSMVSPVEGEVVEINEEVLKNPALLREDPYGKGWLMVVHVPDEESVSRNLLPKALVFDWMRSAAEALYARQPQLCGVTAADGGTPVEDIGKAIPAAEWHALAEEFFLTAGSGR